ncbi:hypothetical protein OOZ19_24310 [Saccharopolyspora sp. NFXS83]|uniref:hypothetical protein n=1 Tax=Saccharopolyspora sp. NFXS83 TaxID=2993560 RepID=UPI00224B5A17|nr:hypothetical protein [Saccharopolyspora sp. NFXS83]MCX2733379.1 hypothetical protein [Saccharopolyspora sp. NFXS83]
MRSGGGGGGWGTIAAQLTGIKTQTEQVRGKVGSGQVTFEPGAAANAAKAYEQAQHRLARLMRNIDALTRVQGLGEYGSATQLAGKFENKAADSTAGAVGLLTQLSDELKDKADMFRQAAKEYAATDESIEQALQRGEQR